MKKKQILEFLSRLAKYSQPLNADQLSLECQINSGYFLKSFMAHALKEALTGWHLGGESRQLRVALCAHYGFYLLMDGRRHQKRGEIHEFLTQWEHPAAALFEDGGKVEDLYRNCRTSQQWCSADCAYLNELLTIQQQRAPRETPADRAIQTIFDRFHWTRRGSNTFCDILTVFRWEPSLQNRMGDQLQPGILLSFSLDKPCPPPGDSSQIPLGFAGDEFKDTLCRIAQRIQTYFQLEPRELLRAVPEELPVEGRSGGLAIWIAQEMALEKRIFPPFVGISISISKEGKTASIAIETVPQKIELAILKGFRILFLPASAEEKAQELAEKWSGLLHIHYIPEGIHPTEATQRILEILGNLVELFPLNRRELDLCIREAEYLVLKIESRELDYDYQRAYRIFQTVEKQTEKSESNLIYTHMHLKSKIEQSRILNHLGETEKAQKLNGEIDAQYQALQQKGQLLNRTRIIYIEFLNLAIIPLIDEFNYGTATKRAEELLKYQEQFDPYDMARVYGTLGQLYVFRSEVDKDWDEKALETLKTSYHWIQKSYPLEIPRQLNYLIKACAVRGDVEGAEPYLAEREKCTEEDEPDRLFFLLERLRLYLTAFRGRHLERLIPQEEREQTLAESGWEIGEPWISQINTLAERGKISWLIANIYRYLGALAGELGQREKGRELLFSGMKCLEKGDTSILQGAIEQKLQEVFYPIYCALWAELALLGERGGEEPGEVVHRILATCRVKSRKEHFQWFLQKTLPQKEDWIKLTQTVHY